MHLRDFRTNGLEQIWSLQSLLHVQDRALEHIGQIIRECRSDEMGEVISRIESIATKTRSLTQKHDRP